MIIDPKIADVLRAYMKAGRMADYLLTGYSISGDGPEQIGDRSVALESLRSAEREARALGLDGNE